MKTYTPNELATIISEHRKWQRGEGGERADLSSADLSSANLRSADLRYANLRSADLSSADLSSADLQASAYSESRGVIWAQVGPVGIGRRSLTAVWQDDDLVLYGGCFRGTLPEFLAAVDGPNDWGWGSHSETVRDRWRSECVTAAWYLQASVDSQLTQIKASA